jgi:hypothetical protein
VGESIWFETGSVGAVMKACLVTRHMKVEDVVREQPCTYERKGEGVGHSDMA